MSSNSAPSGQAALGIFREEALRHHTANHNKVVFPKLVSRRTVFLMWATLWLLLAGGIVAWSKSEPIYAPCRGMAIDGKRLSPQLYADEPALLILVSAENLAKIRTGQRVVARREGAKVSRVGLIVSTGPSILNPRDERTHLGPNGSNDGSTDGSIDGSTWARIGDPAGFAVARLSAGSGDSSQYLHEGEWCEVQVEVGSERVILLMLDSVANQQHAEEPEIQQRSDDT